MFCLLVKIAKVTQHNNSFLYYTIINTYVSFVNTSVPQKSAVLPCPPFFPPLFAQTFFIFAALRSILRSLYQFIRYIVHTFPGDLVFSSGQCYNKSIIVYFTARTLYPQERISLMELRYHIQEPEHQRYIQARRRAKALSPFSLIVTALLTAFPLFVLLYAVVENVLSDWQLGLFALAAVALSGSNFYTRARYWRKDNTKLPIQNVLRAVLIANSNILNSAAADNDQVNEFAEAIKYAAIVLTTVPVLCVYPFLQRYFVKGVMIGAVKG